ncbi:hypothetical protein MY10362_000195 [Beauveria mimosiformis]
MGLVDYSSESDSSGTEAEAPTKPTPKSKISGGGAASKKVPSVVDKSKAGKIIVNLAGNAANAPSDEPPAKRARTTDGGGGGRFSGFNAFLPAPKNTAAKSTAAGSRGVGLRTSAAPGFSRDAADVPSTANVDATGDGDEEGEDAVRTTTTAAAAGGGGKSGGLGLPPPKNAVAEPTIPEGQKPAAEVRLTGKPLMFRPLSVAKGKTKKKTTTSTAAAKLAPPADTKPTASAVPASSAALPEPPSKKKISLFSIPSDDTTTPAPGPSLSSGTGAYEPLFETAHDHVYKAAAQAAAEPLVAAEQAESVGALADDMNLSAAARRELFGRGSGSGTTAQRVVNFNMDREYRHNEALRASGEQQVHNPVRAIQSGGKHSLRQLVGNVQGQVDALEDSFAKGRTNRREASSRYGW